MQSHERRPPRRQPPAPRFRMQKPVPEHIRGERDDDGEKPQDLRVEPKDAPPRAVKDKGNGPRHLVVVREQIEIEWPRAELDDRLDKVRLISAERAADSNAPRKNRLERQDDAGDRERCLPADVVWDRPLPACPAGPKD